MPDPIIYLVRHGQTVWNTKKRRQGWKDSPLTLKGAGQAIANGKRLRDHVQDAARCPIIASPLGRAWQTAALISGELGQDPDQITLDPALRECSYGAWEGLTETEIAQHYPREWSARDIDKWHTAPPGGESYADVLVRIEKWFKGTTFPPRCIVVSHGQTSRVLRGLYAGLSEKEVFALSETQDGFFKLSEGRVQTITEAPAQQLSGVS